MRVLVIEDSPKMSKALEQGLRQYGFTVDVAERGEAGEERAAGERYEAVVLDLMLPDRDGVAVCRNLRRRGVRTPILVLTALDATQDKVEGLDAGADDYLTKPFDFDELVARLRALMRRGAAGAATPLRYADVELDLAQRSVSRAGRPVRLTAREFALLECLMRNADRVLTRTAIIGQVWDLNYQVFSNVVDVCVSSLRRKLDKPFDRPLIHTVLGVGYRFGEPPADV